MNAPTRPDHHEPRPSPDAAEQSTLTTTPTRRRRRSQALAGVAVLLAGLGVSVGVAVASDGGSAAAHAGHAGHDVRPDLQAQAMLATAAYQDVEVAEAHGYASSIDTLGCFQNPDQGGMGVHFINGSLLDDQVDVTQPEALVYELDATGEVVGLVAHEYIVPIDAWTSSVPPRLFGMDFHRHATLPLWVLHTWFWKDNPTGVFSDWNPAVRQCPDGVPVFGIDLP